MLNLPKENGLARYLLLSLIPQMADVPSQPGGEYHTTILDISKEIASLTQPTELALKFRDQARGYDIIRSAIVCDYFHGTRVRIGNHLV